MTAGIYRAWTRGQRRKEFRRLGNELAQLKRSGHASAGTMRACIREEILVLTQASLDMCDGLPPRLVEDLMQADNAPFTRVNAPGIVSFFAPPDDETRKEKYDRLDENINDALVEAGAPPKWSKGMNYRPR